MKIGLFPAIVVGVVGVATMTGCGAVAASAPSRASAPVGSTTLTSAPSTSSLAPAAWEDDEAAPAAPPTWGATAAR